jgi:hypothetical protein
VKGQSFLRALFVGSTVVLWLLAMFVIASLNNANKRLERLQQNLDTVADTVSGMPYWEVHDADGNVVYRIHVPDPADEDDADVGREEP